MVEGMVVPANNSTASAPSEQLNLPYVACEVAVAVVAVAGNLLVILAFRRERRLRRRTNYYIVSLAAADLLVGLLGIPFAVLASVGLPHNLHACLFTVSLLLMLCTISIFCLVAVSVDRYWAILHPLGYSRNVSTKKAVGIICVCWAAGSLVGFLPLLGWHQPGADALQCFFTKVMDYNYLVFLYFTTIIFPGIILAAFYAHIYQVVLKQLRRMERQSPSGGIRGGGSSGTMLRVLGAARKREVKATQNLSIIVLFFVVCWFPLYTINCVHAFCPACYVPPAVMDCCIILSHLNSAGNPLLYAYHLKDFRAALRALLLGAPDSSHSGVDVTGACPRSGVTGVSGAVGAAVPPDLLPLPALSAASHAQDGEAGAGAPPGAAGAAGGDHKMRPCSGSLWSRYVPASDLGSISASASDSAAENGEDGQLTGSAGPRPRAVEQAVSPRTRVSPLRAVGEFLFSSSIAPQTEHFQ